MAQASKMQGEMSKSMVKRHRAKLEQQIVRLDENCNSPPHRNPGLPLGSTIR
jgi:hypothetical protein